jgi:2',3'-cyclic-nucleotide 2'-phosphodiesterase (5'-nucleotidase family)
MELHRYGWFGLVALVLVAAGCAEDGEDGAPGMDGMDGDPGEQGPPGDDGDPGMDGDDGRNALVRQTDIEPGDDCEFGGTRIDSGVDDDGDGMLDDGEIDDTSFLCDRDSVFTLQLLHFADIDGNEATALGNVDEFSALVDGFRNDPELASQTMVVSSGDNLIPGPRWFAAENNSVRSLTGSNEPGHVDHFFMNRFGVVASALGNHDLDQGPGEFADALSSESRGGTTFPGTRFPYLAANVDFSGDEDLSERTGQDGSPVRELGGQVAGSAVYRIGSERIGLVGVSTPQLPSITTTGALTVSGSTTDIGELADAVQPAIDALVAEGIDKIVVLAHLQQLALEKSLAEELTDVDIIVAGGSNTRMGDATDVLYPEDDAFDEPYPFQATDADGNPTLIVNVDGDYKYLGRLVVSFDEDGLVIPGSVDEEVSGAYPATAATTVRVGGFPITEVVTVRDALQAVITTQFENVIGHTDVFLEGRRGVVRTEETNLGNLTADSLKWYSERCDELTNVLALKNGGGIRAEIGNVVVTGTETELFPPFNDGLDVDPGDVSEGQLRGTLRFDNGAVILDVTGRELKTLLEHAVAATAPGATPGQFPQVGGIWFGFDPAGTAQVLDIDEIDDDDVVVGITTPGTRVTDLWVDTNADNIPDTALYTDGVEQAAATDTFTLVTLNFLANGGDNYPFALLENPNRRQIYPGVGFGDPDVEDDDLPDFEVLTDCDPGFQSSFSGTGGEQDALAEYFLAFFPDPASAFDIAETPPAEDRRVQNLSVIADFVPPTAP